MKLREKSALFAPAKHPKETLKSASLKKPAKRQPKGHGQPLTTPQKKGGTQMKRKLVFWAIILTVVCTGPASAADYWYDEYGNSSMGPGWMAPDPYLGGRTSALWYNAPAGQYGDLLIYEGGVISDWIRFTSGNLIFYSAVSTSGPGAPADVGFPTMRFPYWKIIEESGSEGNSWASYTPWDILCPGYDIFHPGGITYKFISDVPAVPVPPSVLLFGGGLLGLLGLGWRRRS